MYRVRIEVTVRTFFDTPGQVKIQAEWQVRSVKWHKARRIAGLGGRIVAEYTPYFHPQEKKNDQIQTRQGGDYRGRWPDWIRAAVPDCLRANVWSGDAGGPASAGAASDPREPAWRCHG